MREKIKFYLNFWKVSFEFLKGKLLWKEKTTFGDILKKVIFSWIFWKIFLKHSWVFLGNNIFNEKEIYHELLERKWDFMKYSFEKLFFFSKGKWNFICLKNLISILGKIVSKGNFHNHRNHFCERNSMVFSKKNILKMRNLRIFFMWNYGSLWKYFQSSSHGFYMKKCFEK